MSSDRSVAPTVSARALASRINGARSRGPRTAAGKARSARNALKHGLCARAMLLIHESAVEFAAFEKALLAELAPEGAMQAVLARQIVSAAWRLARADRVEAEIVTFRQRGDADAGLAVIRDGNTARALPTVLRYRGGAHAELLRTLRTLRDLQAETRVEAAAERVPAPARRRARYLPSRRNEPEQAREIPLERPAKRTSLRDPGSDRPARAPGAKPPSGTPAAHGKISTGSRATARVPDPDAGVAAARVRQPGDRPGDAPAGIRRRETNPRDLAGSTPFGQPPEAGASGRSLKPAAVGWTARVSLGRSSGGVAADVCGGVPAESGA